MGNAARSSALRCVALRGLDTAAFPSGLSLLLVAAAGCNSLLGDVSIEDEARSGNDPSPPGAEVGTGPLLPGLPGSGSAGEGGLGPDGLEFEGACQLGAVQCVGAALQLCVAGGRWITSDVCGSPALC